MAKGVFGHAKESLRPGRRRSRSAHAAKRQRARHHEIGFCRDRSATSHDPSDRATCRVRDRPGLGRPGGDLLSHALRRSTIGAEGFHGRVRDGIGCFTPRHSHQAVQSRPSLRIVSRVVAGSRIVSRFLTRSLEGLLNERGLARRTPSTSGLAARAGRGARSSQSSD